MQRAHLKGKNYSNDGNASNCGNASNASNGSMTVLR